MKKTLLLSFLIPFALVCSCQKQDSTAEQQLAQRKTELDAREKALDEREKALAQQEKLVARRRPAPIPRPAPAVPGSASGRNAVDPQRTVPADLQGLLDRMQELQRKRVPAVRGNDGTVPATEQAASPSPSPTPE
jgi:hypothetical protein